MNNVKIIYGTAWKKERTTALVVQAVLTGFRAIDTACQPKHYREDLVGEALTILKDKHGIPREDLFIQTKFTSIAGQDTSKPLPYDPSLSVKEQVTSSFATTLKNLRTTYVDSYILHSPLDTMKKTVEAWRVLVSLREDGRALAIGVSNTYSVDVLKALEDATGVPVDVVQNRWHENNGWDKEVASYCRERGIQYQSFWTLTGSPTLLGHRVIRSLAEKHSCTPEQAVYRVAQLQNVTPLAGTTDEAHMRGALAVEHLAIDLSDKDVLEAGRIVTGLQSVS